jgi:drug/metabolite transporter (DMT)-like permease
MALFWLSALLIVASSVAYYICQKSIPTDAHPLVSVTVTLLTAVVTTVVILPFFLKERTLAQEASRLNWASVALGLVIVGIDVGYLLLYRSGWNLSLGPVFCNAVVAVSLIPIGVVFYREKLLASNYVGIFMALVGIYLVTRR